MKITLPQAIAVSVLIAGAALFVSAQNVDRQIEAIRKAYTEANAKIAAAERDPETASVYINELRVNSGRASWPAVGIYNSTLHFYYEIQGEGPYPNSLFKVNVRTERSARIETEEFLFDTSGKLIFYFGNDGEVETRAYFSGGRAIESLAGTALLDLTTSKTKSKMAEIKKDADALISMFRASIR